MDRGATYGVPESDATEATSHRSLFCSKEVTLSGRPGASGWGWLPDTSSHDQNPWKRGKGLETELMTGQAYVMKPPKKSPKYAVPRVSGLVNIFVNWKVTHPNSTDTHG